MMAEEAFNSNIIEYLIKRIHNEDTKKGESQISEKIAITEEILLNAETLSSHEDFYEEECQVSLLNWAYEAVHSEDKVKYLDKQQMELLLYNILN